MAGLKPIVGEIKSQILNDNFSYINQKADEAGVDPELEQKVQDIADDLVAHKAESASDDVHGIKTYADTKVSRTGDVLSGNLLFSQSNSAIAKADNAGRIFIAGGTSLTVANGAYLGLEGIDYGEVGQGGNVYISVPSGRRLFISNGYLTLFSSTDIRVGFNSPEGVISANVGSLYLRTNGEANTTLYVKESGTGNVGWVAK